MNWIENLLILAGISLDVFAAVECQGALVAKVNKKRLGLCCAFVAAWQMAALFLGNTLARLIRAADAAHDETRIGCILAAVIFFCLGIRLIVKAVRNDRVQERREERLEYQRFFKIAAATGIYTFLAGIAYGFLGTDVGRALIMIVCLTIAVVVLGMYTGYHFGFEQKTKAYIGGAVLLWMAGADIIVRYIAG